MLDTAKLSGRISETLQNVETKVKEQQQETLDNLIKKTLISDSFLSFNKPEKSPVQWFHWLDTLEHQNTNQSSDFRGTKLEETFRYDSKTGENHASKNSLHTNTKSSSMFGRGAHASGEKIQSLKIPEAMVAFAQAARDLPGWPLMSNKITMHKCEKCSQEFCSPLNLRRHMRATHRRPLNGDKEDLKKKKEQITAYWDKLSQLTPVEAREIISSKNLSLQDLSASKLIHALSAHLHKPGLISFPQSYVRVATAIMEIVQSKSSRFPLKSGELFAILDDASEKNLLYGVTSSSMQRHIFESEPGKVGLETRNLVASLGFLIELRLVKAWTDDKDVEALRCQKALVEEEEAAQIKRAKLQERKRQKKTRRQKDKEKKVNDVSSQEDGDSPSAMQSNPLSSCCADTSVTEISQTRIPDVEDYDISKLQSNCLQVHQSSGDPHESQEFDLQNEKSDSRVSVHQAGGRVWKDRRGEHKFGNVKQSCNSDNRYYDPQHGAQRSARKLFNSTVNPYGNYREPFSVLRRQNNNGIGHTFWAKKAQHNPPRNFEVSEPLKVDDPNHASSIILEQPLRLIRLSSPSHDSVTSHSSSSISARVGSEEHEGLCVSCSLPEQTTVDEYSSGSSPLLVIGSVTIPIENSCTVDKQIESAPKSEYKSSVEVDHMSEGADKTQNHSVIESKLLVRKNKKPSQAAPGSEVIIQGKGQWHNSQNKHGRIKVWRPVTPGDQAEATPPCTSEYVQNAIDNRSDKDCHEGLIQDVHNPPYVKMDVYNFLKQRWSATHLGPYEVIHKSSI